MSTPFYVSQSKASDWQLCKRKYHHRWVENLKPRLPPRPLKFGAIAHEMLEANAHGHDMMAQLDTIAERERKLLEHVEEYGRLVHDMAYIMRAYRRFWSRQPLKFKTIDRKKAIEVPFELELAEDIVAKGKIDGIVLAKDNEWVLEHKTHKDFPNADHRWRNIQAAVYLRMVQLLGWANPAGMLWDYVRSKPPTRPKLLASGKLSLAECDSLPEVVQDAVEEYLGQPDKGLDRDQIAAAGVELAENQTRNLPTWFQRVYTPVQPSVVKSLFADFLANARDMKDYYEKTGKPPRKSIGLHCGWCPFEPICRAELQGNDIDLVRRTQFVFDDSPYQTEMVE